MELKEAGNRNDREMLFSVPKMLYRGNTSHRSTEEDVLRLLLNPEGAFSRKTRIQPMIALRFGKPVGRFVLFQDIHRPELVLIGFFEGAEDCPELAHEAYEAARKFAPEARVVVAGIGGHINYSAGFLLDSENLPPAFGLPHTASWYPEWFSGWKEHRMNSYRFPTGPFFQKLDAMQPGADSGIRIRPLDFRNLARDVRIYTELNNMCFSGHKFWIDRTPEEDVELFSPFRFFLKPENLLFAEKDEKAIGFFLWYPDFNQLASPSEGLGLKHLLAYRLSSRIDTFRFTQIAVHPRYRTSDASLRLIQYAAACIRKRGYKWGEGGFIFESNTESRSLTNRFFMRILGETVQPHRTYAVFERSADG